MDLGAGRSIVSVGPSAIRIAGIGSRLRELGYKVIDEGDLSIKTQEEQKIKNAAVQSPFLKLRGQSVFLPTK